MFTAVGPNLRSDKRADLTVWAAISVSPILATINCVYNNYPLPFKGGCFLFWRLLIVCHLFTLGIISQGKPSIYLDNTHYSNVQRLINHQWSFSTNYACYNTYFLLPETIIYTLSTLFLFTWSLIQFRGAEANNSIFHKPEIPKSSLWHYFSDTSKMPLPFLPQMPTSGLSVVSRNGAWEKSDW